MLLLLIPYSLVLYPFNVTDINVCSVLLHLFKFTEMSSKGQKADLLRTLNYKDLSRNCSLEKTNTSEKHNIPPDLHKLLASIG